MIATLTRLNLIPKVPRRTFLPGNYCGHEKDTPRKWRPPNAHGKRYGVLEYAKQALLHFYYNPHNLLKRLKLLNRKRIRLKRSERREAIMLVAQCCLHYLDMDSLRVGVNNANSAMWLPSLAWIANATGLSLKRTQRAMRDLARAGYVKITYRWTMRPDGSYINKAALREFRTVFFTDLGVDKEQLDLDQHRARKKHARIQQKTPVSKDFPVANQTNFLEICFKALGRAPPKKVAEVV